MAWGESAEGIERIWNVQTSLRDSSAGRHMLKIWNFRGTRVRRSATCMIAFAVFWERRKEDW